MRHHRKDSYNLALTIPRHRLYRSFLGCSVSLPSNPHVSRFALVPLTLFPLLPTLPMNLPVFPIGYLCLKVYIAHRQTCPNCLSSCYANDHICYDSARQGSTTTASCCNATEMLKSTLSWRGACYNYWYVAVCLTLRPGRRARFLAWTTSFRMSASYISVTRTMFFPASVTDALSLFPSFPPRSTLSVMKI